MKTGIRYKTVEGIKVSVEITQWDAIYPYPRKVTKIWGRPLNTDHDHYRATKKYLGDDWDYDLTDNWFEVGTMPLTQQEKLQAILNNI